MNFLSRILGKKIVKSVCVILGLLFFSSYITNRAYFGMIQETVMSYYSMNSSSFSTFAACFSLGYGLSQLFTGSLLSKQGIKVIPIYAFVVGACTIALGFVKNFYLLFLIRTVIGMGCSIASIGYMFMLTQLVDSKYFGFLSSIGITVAFLSASQLTLQLSGFNIRSFTTMLGGTIVIFSILIAIFYSSVTLKKQVKEADSEPVCIKDLFVTFFSTPKLVLLAVYSWFINVAGYSLADGWLGKIVKENFVPAGMPCPQARILMAKPVEFFNYSVAITSIIMPFLSEFLGYKVAFIILSGFQLIGVAIIMLFYKSSIYVLYVGAILIGSGLASHMLPQQYIGQKSRKREAGLYLSIMNSAAMLLGAALSQKFFGFLITIFSKGEVYNTANVVLAIKVFALPFSILAFILIFFINFKTE